LPVIERFLVLFEVTFYVQVLNLILCRELVYFLQLVIKLAAASTKESNSLYMFRLFCLGMACLDLQITLTIYFSQTNFSLLFLRQTDARVNFQPLDLAPHW